MSLKKWEIKLDIHHMELGLPWDKPVDESLWKKVAEYCVNDVVSTEAVFEALKSDYVARVILADVAGGTANDTTNTLTKKLIFSGNKNPQSEFKYRNLGEPVKAVEEDVMRFYKKYCPNMVKHDFDADSVLPWFKGYTYSFGKSSYKGEDPKEGGLSKYVDKILSGEIKGKDLSNALKTAINSVYGLTSAAFKNEFRDDRNVDNIVAKRGALFMMDLRDAVQAKGFTVAHIKTDSIKIPNATPEIIDFVMNFAERYGYHFEHEATYSRMCLINDAVYIAQYAKEDLCKELYGYCPGDNQDHGGAWTATGARFAEPYVFKTLFSHEPIEFKDLCVTKSVKTHLVIDANEKLAEGEHDYRFVGKVGEFCPVIDGYDGGPMYRVSEKMIKGPDGSLHPEVRYDAVGGTKGFKWLEAEICREHGGMEIVDKRYFKALVDDSMAEMSKYGDAEEFMS